MRMLVIGSNTWVDLKIPYQVSKEIYVFLSPASQSPVTMTKLCANHVAIFLEICFFLCERV